MDTDEVLAALEGADASVRASAELVFASSDFVALSCARNPGMLEKLIASGDLLRPLDAGQYAGRAPVLQADTSMLEALAISELRQWRRREMVRIAWRDLAGWASLEETLSELSAFADAAIDAAYQHARSMLALRYGEPRSAS